MSGLSINTVLSCPTLASKLYTWITKGHSSRSMPSNCKIPPDFRRDNLSSYSIQMYALRQSSHYPSILLRAKPLSTNHPKSNPRFNKLLILFLSFLYRLPHPPWSAHSPQPPTKSHTTRTYDSNKHPPPQPPDPAQFQK